MARRLRRLERKEMHPGEVEKCIDQVLSDPAYLVDLVRRSPARPGSQEAAVDAELLALFASPSDPLSGNQEG
ncbi:MAG: hypothetical protein ABSH53_02950 [Holophaga sp.]